MEVEGGARDAWISSLLDRGGYHDGVEPPPPTAKAPLLLVSQISATLGLPRSAGKNGIGDSPPHQFHTEAALWERTIPYDTDFKIEYVDLDEFLKENGLPVDPTAEKKTVPPPPSSPPNRQQQPSPLSHAPLNHAPPQPQPAIDATNGGVPNGGMSHLPSSPASPSMSSCSSVTSIGSPLPDSSAVSSSQSHEFDPRYRSFSEEELKPQPVVKKSKKQYVPPELKDEKYWARRRKNNLAAKRSRDARRMKENQIALRASFLEKENENLTVELEKTRSLLESLKKRLAFYESV